MDENRYAGLATQTHRPDESVYDGLMRVFRTILEPWERHPDMLRAYHRARSAPGGQKLVSRGLDAVVPAAMAVLADADLLDDLPPIVSNLAYGLVARFAAGEIAITEILPTLQRALFRLTATASSRFGEPTNQLVLAEGPSMLPTVGVAAEKSPPLWALVRRADHLDLVPVFARSQRADDVTHADLRRVNLGCIGPVGYRHSTRPHLIVAFTLSPIPT